jgi:hypothetical protein
VNNKMLALYGLKWNPFAPNVPTEALHVTTRLESFCWRVQQLAGDGGFALVTGYEKGPIMERMTCQPAKNSSFPFRTFSLFGGMCRRLAWQVHTGDAHVGSQTNRRTHYCAGENGRSSENREVQP